jgi:nucleoside-diphosphate-sugar epimerase
MKPKYKKVLVTGGCGFIGSEIVSQLLAKGYQVRVADDLSKPDSRVSKGYEFVRADLTDQTQANKVFKGIDACINSAAKIGGIGYFHKYPATILSENNKIHSATFNAAVKNRLKRMVYLSSSMVFEMTKKFPSREEDVAKIPPPASAYGFSKLSGERYCQSFAVEFGLPYTICRPFNAYGAKETPKKEIGYAHVIPDLIKKIFEGQYPLKLLGDGQQTRCFTHVSDVAGGIIATMESKKAVNEAFNISSPQEMKIIDLAKLLWKLCNQKKPFKVTYVESFKHDIKRRVPNSSKAKKILGWQAKIKLKDGLKEVIATLEKKLKK